MANYIAHSRSSYFVPKDEKAFRAWADTIIGAEYHVGQTLVDGEGNPYAPMYCFIFTDSIPQFRTGADGEEVDFNFIEELQEHIADDWEVVLIEIGREKMRYLEGWAALVSKDRVEQTSLSQWIIAKRSPDLKRTLPSY